jgi:nanoRNase/pAp phosphatase (c-di-AMP/oligoRNAs hydrolase)
MPNIGDLFKTLMKSRTTSIIVHNNPDPDALASALALADILKKKEYRRVRIYYDGLIGRAGNKAMIRTFKIKLYRTRNITHSGKRQYVLVDCQPFTGNVTLPEKAKPAAVIDHHPLRKKTKTVPFYDVRPEYGSCASILYEYYKKLDMVIPRTVTTALFHAIFSETQGLGRDGAEEDKSAYLDLLSHINFGQLNKIQNPSLSKEFVSNLFKVLLNTFYYKNLAGVILDELPYPDFVAEMADFLLRVKNITWSLCVGSFGNQLLVSLRTSNVKANAGRVIKRIVPRAATAGGHDMIAGAQMAIEEQDKKKIMELKKDVLRKMLKTLKHTNVRSLYRLITNEEFPLL